jgi:hypothetical protein
VGKAWSLPEWSIHRHGIELNMTMSNQWNSAL